MVFTALVNSPQGSVLGTLRLEDRGPVALFNVAAGETLALHHFYPLFNATGREEAALFNVSQVWMREGPGQTADSGLFYPQQNFQPLTWQYSSG